MREGYFSFSFLRASLPLRVFALSALTVTAIATAQTEPTTSASATLPASAPATSPTTAAALSIDPAKLEGWIARLGADDWRDREGATKELVALGPDALPRLKRLAEETKDEEVRSRAQSAVTQIEEAVLIGASSITMHLKNATPKQAFEELCRQAHAPMYRTQPANLLESTALRPADIDLDKASYFTAMELFSEKFGISLANMGNGVQLVRGRGNRGFGFAGNGPNVETGPFRFSCNSLSYTQTVQYQQPAGEAEIKANTSGQVYMQFSLFAEPKIGFASRNLTTKIEECVDDRGVKMTQSQTGGMYGNGGPILPVMIYLTTPSQGASKIERLKGTIDVPIAVRFERFEVADLAEPKEKSQSVGGWTYTVKSFAAAGKGYTVGFSIACKSGESGDVYSAFNSEAVELLDVDGNALQGSAGGGRSDGRSMESTMNFRRITVDGKATGDAVRLVWRLPVETRTISIPFEFKNLPLPK